MYTADVALHTFEELTQGLPLVIRIGGVSRDVPDGWLDKVTILLISYLSNR